MEEMSASTFWAEYSELMRRYDECAESPAQLATVIEATEDLCHRVEQALEQQIYPQENRALEAWCATFYKMAAACAQNIAEFTRAARLYRAANQHVDEIETRVGLIESLCSAGKLGEACIELNAVSSEMLIGNDPESACRLLTLICNETSLATGVSCEVLRLCVVTVNLRRRIKITFDN